MESNIEDPFKTTECVLDQIKALQRTQKPVIQIWSAHEYISHAAANFDQSTTEIVQELKAKAPVLVCNPASEASPNPMAHSLSIGLRATGMCIQGDPLETNQCANIPILRRSELNCILTTSLDDPGTTKATHCEANSSNNRRKTDHP